jgi:purine-cytosine permease-like protein
MLPPCGHFDSTAIRGIIMALISLGQRAARLGVALVVGTALGYLATKSWIEAL